MRKLLVAVLLIALSYAAFRLLPPETSLTVLAEQHSRLSAREQQSFFVRTMSDIDERKELERLRFPGKAQSGYEVSVRRTAPWLHGGMVLFGQPSAIGDKVDVIEVGFRRNIAAFYGLYYSPQGDLLLAFVVPEG